MRIKAVILTFIPFLIAAVSHDACSAETNWLRIGQVDEYIVDINLSSIVKSGNSVSADARLLPRSSKADWESLEDKPVARDVRPTFFKISRASYSCEKDSVYNIEEMGFDVNVVNKSSSRKQELDKVTDEYEMIRKYVCRK